MIQKFQLFLHEKISSFSKNHETKKSLFFLTHTKKVENNRADIGLFEVFDLTAQVIPKLSGRVI